MSILLLIALLASFLPNLDLRLLISFKISVLEFCERKKLINPGPATSTRSIKSKSLKSIAIFLAISLGSSFVILDMASDRFVE